MNNIIVHIEYLVRRHDCVVIPKWGAFIAQYQGAYFDENNSTFFPPKRELSFNPSVCHNDGLLASSIARKNKISFEKAQRLVEQDIEAMKCQLEKDGEISLGRLGRFINQRDVSVIFEPSDHLLRFDSFGNFPVKVSPVITRAKQEAENEVHANKRQPVLRKGIVKFSKIAAAVLLLIAVGVAVTIPNNNDGEHNYASVSPIVSSASKNEAAKQNDGNSYHKITEDIVYTDSSSQKTFEELIKETDSFLPVADSDVRFDKNDKYCLVIASLPTEALANKYITETNGAEMGILAKDGKYRVYVATGQTNQEALAQKNKSDLAAKYPDAWVCRK